MRFATLAACVTLTVGLAAGCADGNPLAPDASAATLDVAPPQLPTADVTGPPSQTGVTRGSGPGVVCGIPVQVTVFNAGAAWDPLPGGPPARQARTNVLTLTNPDNGKSVSVQTAGRVTREILEVFETFEDGSPKVFRLREEFDGSLSRIQTSEGELLTIGAGRLILEFTVNLLPGGFFLTDVEFVFEAGTTEQAPPLNSPPFCEIVVDALT